MDIDNITQELDPSMPLVICDVDEVLINLLDPLRSFLHDHDYTIDITSHSFGRTIKKRECGNPIEGKDIPQMVDIFFENCIEQLPFYEGALDALKTLEKKSQLLILTNLPHKFGNRRRDAMEKFGVNYPLITNQGEKGPMVKKLANATNAKVIFIDDTPAHHTSVAKYAPDVHRLHFIAHPELAAAVPMSKDAHERIDCWKDATDHILDVLQRR